jgi:hypothetical protein
MPKGQRTIIDTFKEGPAKEKGRVNDVIELLMDHDGRINDLERGRDFETTIIVKDGVAYHATVPMTIDAIVVNS